MRWLEVLLGALAGSMIGLAFCELVLRRLLKRQSARRFLNRLL